jgi:hypothetical protein
VLLDAKLDAEEEVVASRVVEHSRGADFSWSTPW